MQRHTSVRCCTNQEIRSRRPRRGDRYSVDVVTGQPDRCTVGHAVRPRRSLSRSDWRTMTVQHHGFAAAARRWRRPRPLGRRSPCADAVARDTAGPMRRPRPIVPQPSQPTTCSTHRSRCRIRPRRRSPWLAAAGFDFVATSSTVGTWRGPSTQPFTLPADGLEACHWFSLFPTATSEPHRLAVCACASRRVTVVSDIDRVLLRLGRCAGWTPDALRARASHAGSSTARPHRQADALACASCTTPR